MLQSVETASLTYTHHDTRIHEFVFLEPTTKAIDAWITQVEVILKATPSDQQVMYIFDVTQTSVPPLAYALRRVKDVHHRFPNRPYARVAFVMNSGFLISLVETFVATLRSQRDLVRFFRADQRHEAVAWLLNDR